MKFLIFIHNSSRKKKKKIFHMRNGYLLRQFSFGWKLTASTPFWSFALEIWIGSKAAIYGHYMWLSCPNSLGSTIN